MCLDFSRISEEFAIVRLDRFQCAGWVLSAIMQVERLVEEGCVWLNPEIAVNALVRFPQFEVNIARSIIEAATLSARFSLVWNALSREEKSSALGVDYRCYHNFWPGFDYMAQAAAEHAIEVNMQKEMISNSRYALC